MKIYYCAYIHVHVHRHLGYLCLLPLPILSQLSPLPLLLCTYWSLEGAVEVGEEGVVAAEGQNPLLDHGTLHVIVLQHDVLFEGFYGQEFVTGDHLG